MRRAPAPLLPIAFVLLITGCAAAKDYPTLERRPAELRAAEQQRGSGQPVAPQAVPAPAAPLSAELGTRLSQLVEQARTAHQRFSAKRASTERTVLSAGRAAPGSESWSVATIALSDLESARSDAMLALAELDQLYTGEAIDASQSGNSGAIDAIGAARDQVTAVVSEEDTVLAALRSRLGG